MNGAHGPTTGCCHRHTAGTATAPAATGTLRHEHEVILRALALLEGLGRDLEAGRTVDPAALAALVDFFATFTDRCHHAKEEQHLFPALERRGVARRGGPVGVMLAEHAEGRALLEGLRAAEPGRAAPAIQRFVTLLRAHIDKENSILFALADQLLDDAEQGRLAAAFEALEQQAGGPGVHERLLAGLERLEAAAGVLDVRALPPRERHPRIFSRFDALAPGTGFVLVNDHDPKPLYYQLAAERPGAFSWQYLEQGPEVWRVAIGRTA